MNLRSLASVFALILIAVSVPTRSFAADKAGDAASSEAKEGKKNTTVLVVAATPEKVHGAALEALAAIGCKVKSDTPTQIEGKRSNKIGLAVGSGGEKLFVSIKALSDGKTEVTVTTKKTLVGIVGQKLWNEEVAQKIRDAVK